jgi:hypothetical protein
VSNIICVVCLGNQRSKRIQRRWLTKWRMIRPRSVDATKRKQYHVVDAGILGGRWSKMGQWPEKCVITIHNNEHYLKHDPPWQIVQGISMMKVLISVTKYPFQWLYFDFDASICIWCPTCRSISLDLSSPPQPQPLPGDQHTMSSPQARNRPHELILASEYLRVSYNASSAVLNGWSPGACFLISLR